MTGTGSVVGAVLGTATKLVDINVQKKARERAENRPKRRRLKSLQEQHARNLSNRQRALVAMAQAHQNFASMY